MVIILFTRRMFKMGKIEIFLCYAREDEVLYKELVKHLRMPDVDLWYDHNLSPGTQWKDEIDLILLLAWQLIWHLPMRESGHYGPWVPIPCLTSP